MPQVIIPSDIPPLDGSVRSLAWAFLEKLRKDDTAPGLRIKQLRQAADRRVRTGRVNQDYRAVLIKLTGSDDEPRYIYLGTFKHDVANEYAANLVFQRNPQTSAAEVIRVDLGEAGAPAMTDAPPSAAPSTAPSALPVLQTHGTTFEDLIDLGISPKTAYEAILAADLDRLLEIAIGAPSAFQTDALLMLGDGSSVGAVRATYDAVPVEADGADSDDDLIEALKHPAARMQFSYLTDDADLRAAIESNDFARWRIFLHPEQRAYVEAGTTGPFRLSGGAGTGKTVVLLHRARRLHRENPAARILLTTYNKTLAAALKEQLRLLDSTVVLAKNPGDRGVYVGTLDAVAWHLVSHASAYGLDVSQAATGLLGRIRADVVPATDERMWDAALRGDSASLPTAARTRAFFEAEYGTIVVPGRITTRDEYLHARRQGRGVALGRAQRGAVWDVIEAYRAATADASTTNYDEKAMIAATALDTAFGNGAPRVADHVLVDEAQDLNPARLVLLRALVAAGNDDLFLAEDSQQRIYAPRTVLSRHGIHVAGRSQRLQLNYRTTAQNVGYATAVLGGQEIVDLEDGVVDASGLRSARSGPPPTANGYDTPEAAYNAAATTVRSWLADGATPHTVAVLVRTGNDAMALVRHLIQHEIPTQHVGAKDTPREDRVVVMTMHRSKGMEFRNVLVFGTTAESTMLPDRLSDGDPTSALLRERSLLYVATTRARERVALIWHGAPSALLPSPRTASTVIGLVRASEREERESLAREVHDGVGHSLAQIALQVSALEAAPDPATVRETSARIRATARRARSELQNVLNALLTGAEGLAEVSFDDLSRLLGDLKNQGARITSTVVVTEGHTADGALALACYRIVQESVTNALRHAEGLPVDITLRGAPTTGVTIVVHNPLPNGVSVVPAPTRAHSGIAGMSDRAVKLGGTLSARAADGRFVVDARIPWKFT